MVRKTAYTNDEVRSGGSDVPMGRIVTRRCDRDDRIGSRYYGTVDLDIDIAVVYSRAVLGQDSFQRGREVGPWGHRWYQRIGK